MQVYYGTRQLRFLSASPLIVLKESFRKIIYFILYSDLAFNIKGHRLPFPTPWEANIAFFRAVFGSTESAPYRLSLTWLLL